MTRKSTYVAIIAVGAVVSLVTLVCAPMATTWLNPSDEIPWTMTEKVIAATTNDAHAVMRERYPCAEHESDLRRDQIVEVRVATDLDTNNPLVLITKVYPDASVNKTVSCVSADGQILHQVYGSAVADFIRTNDCVVNQPEYITMIDEYTFHVCTGGIGYINKDWTPSNHTQ